MIKQIVKEIWMNSKIKYIDIFVYYSFYFKYERKSRKKKITYKKRGQLRPLSKKYDMCFELTNIQDIQEVLLHLKTLYLRC